MESIDKVKIGKYCKNFREQKLHISLTDFCKEMSENIKNVSSFENGRANNIKYLYLYSSMCDDEIRNEFLQGLFNIL